MGFIYAGENATVGEVYDKFHAVGSPLGTGDDADIIDETVATAKLECLEGA